MANVTPISARFLPISCLCARVSHFWQQTVLVSILVTSVLYTAQWKLMTMGITFDNGPDRLSITPCLQVDPSYPK